MTMNLGIPLKLLKEFLQRKITIETSCGNIYEGKLIDAEENMSVCLNKVDAKLIDGRTVRMKNVYIRGARIRLISLPEDDAKEALQNLLKPSFRGRGRGGGFRGGRGGGFRGGRSGGFRGGRGGGDGGRHGGKPSYDRHRY